MLRILNWLAERLSRELGMSTSQLFPSPPKFFLLRRLIRCLDDSAGMSVGLDAACADFKYRGLFKTDHYVGLDLEMENLNRGLVLRSRKGDLGLLANLLHLDRAPEVADVVVSTHTLASLPADLRFAGVKALATAVVANGTLFFNLPSQSDSDAIAEYLQERFGVVERTVYAARLFMAIERFFAYRTGTKHPFGLAFIGAGIVLSYALSYFEELEWVRKNGVYTIYWCRHRKSEGVHGRMNLLRDLSLE
jgi:hypothetical protein